MFSKKKRKKVIFLQMVREQSCNHLSIYLSIYLLFSLQEKCPYRIYSDPHYPAFRLNTETCSVSLRIHPEFGKRWTRTTPSKDLFYAVLKLHVIPPTDKATNNVAFICHF